MEILEVHKHSALSSRRRQELRARPHQGFFLIPTTPCPLQQPILPVEPGVFRTLGKEAQP